MTQVEKNSESETEGIDTLCAESGLSEEDFAKLEDPDDKLIDIRSLFWWHLLGAFRKI